MIFSMSFKIFYWIIIALWCVSFHCTAKWLSCIYTYIPSFLDFLPIQVTAEHWVELPVLYSRFWSVAYFKHSSVYMPISISQFIPLSLSPLGVHTLFFTSVSLFLLCKEIHLYHFLRFFPPLIRCMLTTLELICIICPAQCPRQSHIVSINRFITKCFFFDFKCVPN